MKQFVRCESADAINSAIQENPFLVSRRGCTLLLSKKPRLWLDNDGAVSSRLLELLRHDPEFLRATDARGVPVSHAIFMSGIGCNKAFDYVISHPTFSLHKRTMEEGNSVAHSLATSVIQPERFLTEPYLHLILRSKVYMANQLFDKYQKERGLFCRLNKDHLQPWQLCNQLACKLRDAMEDPAFLGQARDSISEAADMMDEVGIALRMGTFF